MEEQHITHIVRTSSLYSERETAIACHLTISAIRHLHTLGLIHGEETTSGLCYNEEQISQLRRIRRLRHDLGINLAGIEVILHLLKRLETLNQELEQERNS